jgi:hypothetical protein
MPNYIIITESALDICLLSNSFTEDFLPKHGGEISKLELNKTLTGYTTAEQSEQTYFALINTSCLNDLKSTNCHPADIYRRIARVVKGLKSPPIHLPRQWSEYHHKNLLAFFALPKINSTSKRWVADLDGPLNGVRFNTLASSNSEINLSNHTPDPWPETITEELNELLNFSRSITRNDKNSASSLAAEIDLKAIGSTSVANNRSYDEWVNHLTHSQKETLNHPIDTSIRIVGPAGSGKTLALCMRAMQISRAIEVQQKGKKILIATHSWAMAERIDGVLHTLNQGAMPSGITTFPLLSLLELHAGHIGQQRTDVIGDDSSDGRYKSMEIIRSILNDSTKRPISDVSSWISAALSAPDDSRARLELVMNLYEEISGVLTASGVAPDDPDSIRQYINDTREDWMPPFITAADRGLVISIYRNFYQELIDRSSITTDQFVLDSIRVLETFTWRMRKETDGYDYILVDELQLFDPQERSALELLGRSKKGVPFITAEDPSQGVFSALNTRAGSTQNELIYLDTVHRFNKEIFEFISFIYQKFPLNTLPLRIEQHKEIGNQLPTLYSTNGDREAIELAVNLATRINESAQPNDRICLATLGDVDIELATALADNRMPVTRLASFDDVEQLSYSKRSIIVAPWQFVGGTQFSHVIVVASAISQPSSQFGKLRELTSIYLSCSRATQSLSIVCSNYIPAVTWEAQEHNLLEHRRAN